MRVLRTQGCEQADWTPRLCTHRGQPYAILSHRWASDPNHEVLFADIEEVDELHFGQGEEEYHNIIRNAQYAGAHPGYKPAFKKVQGAARTALRDGYAFIWIDTCCIDKNSSSELSEAINSMWTWYKNSAVCYAYLADVADSVESEFAASSWWMRGWTLQELLAPRHLVFYTAEWESIGPKEFMDLTISEITNINPNVVNGTIALQSVSIAQRMSWASKRKTERVEDVAYCLLGLFGVNMPLLYGEGQNAFLRLQQEIIRESDDESIFAWRDESIGPDKLHGLLAASPRAFATCSKATRYHNTDTRTQPYSMTNKGLSLTVNLHPVDKRLFVAELYCPNPESNEEYTGIFLEKSSITEQYARVRCGEWASPQPRREAKETTVYVKQRQDQRAAYTSLKNLDWADMRLLRILPAEEWTTVELELVEANMLSSRYSIVSHVWDRSGDTRTVLINSEAQEVSRNLHDFLEMCRRYGEDRLLWVDYICVDVLDQLEVDHVFRIWSQISAYAEECIVWLGDLSENNGYEFAQRHPLYGPKEFRMSAPATTKSDVEGSYNLLLSIASHPYWRRSWIVQEVSLLNNVQIEFFDSKLDGSLSLERMTLEELWDLEVSVSEHARVHRLGSIDTLYMLEVLQFARTWPKSAKSSQRGLINRKSEPCASQMSLEDLLTKFQYHEAKDPRDQVYALVTFSNLAIGFNFDYNLSLAEVVCHVAASLGNTLTLTILPKLLTALRISELPAKEHMKDNREFNINHTVHLLDTTKVLNFESYLNNHSSKNHVCYTLEDNFEVPGGLVLVEKPTSSLQERSDVHFAACVYHHTETNHCLFSKLPAQYQRALVNTSVLLQGGTTSQPQVLLKTDSNGLLALAFCMQSTPGGLPRIFENAEELPEP